MTKKILLIGGSGFLGRKTAKILNRDTNYNVTIGDVVKPVNSDIKFVSIDVLNSSILNHEIKNHDIIINFAGQITTPINTCFRINTEGIENITKAVKQYNKQFFQISTVAVYGTTPFADKNSSLNPENPYAACKSFSEYLINTRLTSPCILRISNLYGEDQIKGLFVYLLKSFMTDKKLQFNNDGNIFRFFLHVEDCAVAIYQAVNKNLSGIYNVSGEERYGLKELIKMIEDFTSIKYEITFEKAKLGENIGDMDYISFYKDAVFTPKNDITSFIKNNFIRNE